jgi:uncharacterized BrkB/YihY/UPF0761 family membrane protein
VRGRGWRDLHVHTLRKFVEDRGTVAAGSMAYHWFVAIMPSLIALLGVTGLLHLGTKDVDRILRGLERLCRPEHRQSSPTRSMPPRLGRWLGRRGGWRDACHTMDGFGGLSTLQTGLDIADGVPDRRFVAKRLRTIPLMIATLVLGGLSTALIVFGAPIGSARSA